MQQTHMSDAFKQLRSYVRRQNTRLHDLAQAAIDGTTTLDEPQL